VTGLGIAAIRDLAARHGIQPSRALAQHFLVDPNLARAIASDARVGPDDRVIEVGPGLGSLTVALAATGARVLAIELDRALLPALDEVVGDLPLVDVLRADATTLDWTETLGGEEAWVMCASLPYNVATPLVLDVVANVKAVTRLVVLVQREVGQRLLAGPGDEGYGPASLRVANHAIGTLVRRVPVEVFWPKPAVESVVLRLERRDRPTVERGETSLWAVVDAGFAERRKTIRNALRRLGVPEAATAGVLAAAGVDPSARAEELALPDFARIAEAAPSLPSRG
jgi:16S rRNA (adenine1518-N6/adenine1519-N6)-dimethyltransferase